MLNNPRSRVNNRTEANGKPCRFSYDSGRMECPKEPKARGRPKKSSPKEKSPKEAAGKKKAKKSGKPKYDVI
jgi:hypothetical protein